MARKDPERPQVRRPSPTLHRGLDAKSLEQIGDSLKAHYDDLVRAPVPKKFLDLLDQLEAQPNSTPDGAGDEPGPG
jgi:hypothetical protein